MRLLLLFLFLLHITETLSAAEYKVPSDEYFSFSAYYNAANTGEKTPVDTHQAAQDSMDYYSSSAILSREHNTFLITQKTPRRSATLFAQFWKQTEKDVTTLAKFTYTESIPQHSAYVAQAEIFSKRGNRTTIFLKEEHKGCEARQLFPRIRNFPVIDNDTSDDSSDTLPVTADCCVAVNMPLPHPDTQITMIPSSDTAYYSSNGVTGQTHRIKVSVPVTDGLSPHTPHAFSVEASIQTGIASNSLRVLQIYSTPDDIYVLNFRPPVTSSPNPYTLPLKLYPPYGPSAITSIYEAGSIKTEVATHFTDNEVHTRLTTSNGDERRVISVAAQKNVTWSKPQVTLAQCTYAVYSEEQQPIASDTVTIYGVTACRKNIKECTVKIAHGTNQFDISTFGVQKDKDKNTETNIATHFSLPPAVNQDITTHCILALPHTKVRYTASPQCLTIKNECSPCTYSLTYNKDAKNFPFYVLQQGFKTRRLHHGKTGNGKSAVRKVCRKNSGAKKPPKSKKGFRVQLCTAGRRVLQAGSVTEEDVSDTPECDSVQ